MSLHRLSSIAVGVPNVTETHGCCTDFGLTPGADGWLSTQDGGRQLRLVQTPTRRLIEIVVGADHQDDVDAAAARLGKLGILVRREQNSITALEPTGGFRVSVCVTRRTVQPKQPPIPYNGPGWIERACGRAPGVLRVEPVRPRKLGHVVVGSPAKASPRATWPPGSPPPPSFVHPEDLVALMTDAHRAR